MYCFPIIGEITGVQVAMVVTWSEQRSLYFRDHAKWYSVSRSGTDGGRTPWGLSFGTSMTKIVIPQAVKNILPTLGNEFISLVKRDFWVVVLSEQQIFMLRLIISEATVMNLWYLSL